MMMARDPNDRPTAQEMLQHQWIRENGCAGDNEIVPEVLQRVKNFAAMNKLKKQALMVRQPMMSAMAYFSTALCKSSTVLHTQFKATLQTQMFFLL